MRLFCLLIMSNFGWLKNIDAVNIGRIRLGLPRLSHYYWSVEEQDDRQALICNYGLSEVIAYNKCNRAKVLPVTVLKIAILTANLLNFKRKSLVLKIGLFFVFFCKLMLDLEVTPKNILSNSR